MPPSPSHLSKQGSQARLSGSFPTTLLLVADLILPGAIWGTGSLGPKDQVSAVAGGSGELRLTAVLAPTCVSRKEQPRRKERLPLRVERPRLPACLPI